MQDHRIQPLVAIRALRRLLRDPEKTEEVFVILRALTGRSVLNAFNRFKSMPTGQAILTKERDLVALLEDCLLYTSPSPRDLSTSRMPSSA